MPEGIRKVIWQKFLEEQGIFNSDYVYSKIFKIYQKWKR